MGHAHHFLSRLDRVGAAEVELALGCYREPDVVRFVLEESRLPEGAARVAIALPADPSPPMMIVTRDGRFVTCLGAGMKTEVPVVSRAALDRLLAEHGELRERPALVGTLRGEGTRALLKMLHRGPNVSRETMREVAALAPVYLADLVDWQLDTTDKLAEVRFELVRALRKADKLRAAEVPRLEAFHTLAWTSAHLAVLIATARRPLQRLGDAEAGLLGHSVARGPVEVGVLATAARGLFAAARFGPSALPQYREALAKLVTGVGDTHTVLGWAAIALRHPEARAELEAALAGPHAVAARVATKMTAGTPFADAPARLQDFRRKLAALALEAAPPLWTPRRCPERGVPCPSRSPRTPSSSARRSSNWPGSGALPPSCRSSSRSPSSRAAPGSGRARWTRARAATASRPMSVRSYASSVAK
jgi:hypothetical protein